jgi:hypothetical protein
MLVDNITPDLKVNQRTAKISWNLPVSEPEIHIRAFHEKRRVCTYTEQYTVGIQQNTANSFDPCAVNPSVGAGGDILSKKKVSLYLYPPL